MSNADAFAAVAHSALATSKTPDAARCQVIIHADSPTLSGEQSGGRCHIDDGPALPPETARRLACDAAAAVIAVVDGADGSPLHIGRKSRTIPSALRRALRCRDGGCRFPGCSNRRFVDGHHVRHWVHGGETSLPNVLLLCRRHHRLHESGYQVESPRPHVFVFTRPDGQPIPAAPPAAPRGPGLADQHHRLGLNIGPGTCRSLGQGEPFDLGLTIDALLGPRHHHAPPSD